MQLQVYKKKKMEDAVNVPQKNFALFKLGICHPLTSIKENFLKIN